jgi:hypothetical protein
MNENTALVTIPETEIRLGSLAVSRPTDMIDRASEIATALATVVKDRKLSRNISGREYVYVEGWATMGAMIGILPREVRVTEHDNGDFEAVVELIRVTDGAVVGQGSALVGYDEPTWNKRPRYAKRSMAITRATGKAYRLGFSWIMTLAGYAPTPAEEMDGIETRSNGQESDDGEWRKLTSADDKPRTVMATPGQVQRMGILANRVYQNGELESVFRPWLAEQYHGIKSRKELTQAEAAEVIGKLEAAEKQLDAQAQQ